MEMVNTGSAISVFDCRLKVSDFYGFSMGTHWNPPNSDRYLDFNPAYPRFVQGALTSVLVIRVDQLCNNDVTHKQEIQRFHTVVLENGHWPD